MKTAISLPDDLGTVIQDFIEQAQLSRSEFFQLAAKEYLNRYAGQAITQSLNNVYEENTNLTETTFLQAAIKHWGEHSKDDKW